MEIKREKTGHREPVPLDVFADMYGLTLRIVERSDCRLPRFYAEFEHVEILTDDEMFVRSGFGNGNTEEEAVRQYASNISRQRIVIHRCDRGKAQKVSVPLLGPPQEKPA